VKAEDPVTVAALLESMRELFKWADFVSDATCTCETWPGQKCDLCRYQQQLRIAVKKARPLLFLEPDQKEPLP